MCVSACWIQVDLDKQEIDFYFPTFISLKYLPEPLLVSRIVERLLTTGFGSLQFFNKINIMELTKRGLVRKL